MTSLLKSRCYNLVDLMSEGKGKSNLEKYNEAVESIAKKREQYRNLSVKAIKTKDKLRAEIEKLETLVAELEPIKNEPPIGETAYNVARSLYQKAKYKRSRPQMHNKYVKKGLLVEAKSIEHLSIQKMKFYHKNEQYFENDYLMGCPDMFEIPTIEATIDEVQAILDAKNNYDLDTFLEKKVMEENDPRYEWQLQGYLHLLPHVPSAQIVYFLLNAPFDLIVAQIKAISYQYEGEEFVPIEEKLKIAKNLIYEADAMEQFVQEKNFLFELQFHKSQFFKDWMQEEFVHMDISERIHEMPKVLPDPDKHRAIEERVLWARKYVQKTFSWPTPLEI